ncbi:hypothetical protein LNK15_10420 [Jeotgalicoccus huakuii]|uniref:hypothetical protein n=1 Tax=Jeotgalicoccus sp. S0W5 TaxID=2527874 RepID=UPI0014152782|nr:hypothetical protein [Jeotgalicoccus sp. S0W5]MCK1977469.1 hypothetical protein [Jeotgalicoccus huakuii]
MVNNNYDQDNELDEINRQIEEELNNYNPEEDEKPKKQFLTISFLGTLMLLIMILLGIFKTVF